MKKWVAALRSGQYFQGPNYLKQTDKAGQVRHCCLGVLCELYSQETSGAKFYEYSKGQDDKCWYFGGYRDFAAEMEELPIEVMEWSGITYADGKCMCRTFDSSYKPCNSLAELNDSGRKSFAEIADVIESNWEYL